MLKLTPLVFLLDVDNTVLDNDHFGADLRARLQHDFGAAECGRYWSIYAARRDELGYADYIGTLEQFRIGCEDDPALLHMSAFLLDYPFSQQLYPAALDAIAHLRNLGVTAILSDGDIVFQPRKIQCSGLWDAVDGRVMVCLHKEQNLDAMQRRFPAQHYVMIDDKPQLLAAMKRTLGAKLTTVFVRQGHYAAASANATIDPVPDRSIERIGDLLACDRAYFSSGAPAHVKENA